MSKELKAFKRIKKMYVYFVKHYRDLEPKLMICEKEDFDDVETALKEYEGAKNHIKALNEERVESSLKLKALEIIKDKEVCVADFIYACMCSQKDLKEYYNCDSNYEFAATCVGWGKEDLTKEEFDLLKEILK